MLNISDIDRAKKMVLANTKAQNVKMVADLFAKRPVMKADYIKRSRYNVESIALDLFNYASKGIQSEPQTLTHYGLRAWLFQIAKETQK
jgi:hypothetical protein